MSTTTNNPITNAIDFASHGTKGTSVGMVENQFSVTQSGSGADPSNTALSGYSLQSDMLTSAYFNSEVGDLRETLAAYQIKIDTQKKQHRAVFMGGINKRGTYLDGTDNKSVAPVSIDVNIGNYPVDVADTDTNNGLSWGQYKGVPNMTLKGNSFSGSMPIFPLTMQNKAINDQKANLPSNLNLADYGNITSFMDVMELLKNTFGLSSVKTNLTTGSMANLVYNSTTGIGDSSAMVVNTGATEAECYTNISEANSGMLGRDVYVSLTSAVTQWVKICKVYVKVESIANKQYSGLNYNNAGTLTPIDVPTIEGLVVKLIVDGSYCPRQMIGNGMSHQQLFVWGRKGDQSDKLNSLLQFTQTDYMVYAKDTTGTTELAITRDINNEKEITFTSTGSFTAPTVGQFLYTKGVDPLHMEGLYKVVAVNGSTYTLDKQFSPGTNNFNCKVLTANTTDMADYVSARFNIDEIRDRYSMLQLLSHVGRIYRASTGLSLPLKLVEYVAQIKAVSSISLLLKYVSLCELYTFATGSTVDIGKKLHQIFNFIQNDNNYYSLSEGGNYGVALRYWDDAKDCVVSGEQARFSCLNTNLQTHSNPNSSLTYLVTSNQTDRVNKVKHVVITNLPGFTNGRYGTSMSSSNLTNGFFGSLSIDLSYSDTHTPVDVNGMTVHQWDIDNTNIIDGQNNPARWNVNADEAYLKSVTAASVNC